MRRTPNAPEPSGRCASELYQVFSFDLDRHIVLGFGSMPLWFDAEPDRPLERCLSTPEVPTCFGHPDRAFGAKRSDVRAEVPAVPVGGHS